MSATVPVVAATASCPHCLAGREVFGGAFSAPFHALEDRDPETGCLFVECPNERERWLAEQRVREAGADMLASLREIKKLLGVGSPYAVMRADHARLDVVEFVTVRNVFARAEAAINKAEGQ